jgi:hypothetical protein
VAGAIRDMKIALVFPSVAPYFGARLSLRTMSNSQPAVACGYGEAQQGISTIQGKYTKIWSVGNSLLDIGYSVPRKI